MVAFKDGREIPLPPGTGFVDKNGKVRGRGVMGVPSSEKEMWAGVKGRERRGSRPDCLSPSRPSYPVAHAARHRFLRHLA